MFLENNRSLNKKNNRNEADRQTNVQKGGFFKIKKVMYSINLRRPILTNLIHVERD